MNEINEMNVIITAGFAMSSLLILYWIASRQEKNKKK